ncbi:uncharacterized protein LOC133561290 [Nerophis ophidion]|uniref:uncharacterized protein LOC133561290 n=1 Tax=Nerophis ophidion TaxID=159077 RepID=UPI002AE017FC|nr:uncharacterized protein LOC133561290 [Nerophis ophidion]
MRAEMEGAVDGDRVPSERRPSILLLQNMLKKASQSSLNNEYQTLVSSPSELSISSVDGWRSKQDAFKTENKQPVPASAEIKAATLLAQSSQNVASSNPFYSNYMESENKYNQDQDGVSVPQPQFQSSPLENEATMSDPHKDFIQAFSLNHVQDSFPTSQSVSTRGCYHGANPNSVDTYTENLPVNLYKDSKSHSSNMQDFFQNSREDENVFARYPSTLANPSPDKDLCTSSKGPVSNLFYSASTKFQTNVGGFSHKKLADAGLSGSDLDAFSPFSTAEPFPSPLVKNLFGDGGIARDSFGATPFDSKDNFGSSPLVQSNYSDALHDIVLTTPQGSNHGILHPTPFNQAQKLMGSPDSSPTESEHVQFSRRPPKPLPRSKPSRPPKPAYSVEPDAAVPPKPPPKPFKPLPKLPIHLKTDAEDHKAADMEDYPVFEDILLMGQERCVEDWPEDSPQLDPDFKPSGKFKLRRESLKMKMDHEVAEGGSVEDLDGYGTQGKKKGRNFSLMSRRGSKDTFPGDNRSFTLPTQRKSSKDYFYEMNSSPVEKEDGMQSWSDTKKKDPLKKKVNKMLRRASTSLINKHSTAESKQDDDFIKKKMQMKEPTNTQHSQEAMLEYSMNVEEKVGPWEADGYTSNGKKKKSFKLISKKNLPEEQSKGAYGFSNRTDSNEYIFEDDDGLRSPHSTRQDGLVDMNAFSASMPTGLNDQELYWPEDYKSQRKSMKKKMLHLARHSSKEDMLNTNRQHYEELNSDDYKRKKNKFKASVPPPVQSRKQKPIHSLPELEEPGAYSHASSTEPSYSDHWLGEDDVMRSGNPRRSAKVDYNYEVDELAICKQKKSKRKSLWKHKSKISMNKEWDDASEDSAAMSEAAHAEMLAAQRDIANSVEDTEGDGDTDSLMEWWNTVEQWDELPSDDEEKNDDSTSFTILANKVQRGLRVFNKIFMERAEVLWQHVIRLHALAEDIIIFHQKAKAAGITGGTTAAVGGVTAIAGLALAPFTFGASLIITAVGVGVATAGGITTASATISDNVNNMHERKKVEAVLQDYDLHFQDVAKVLYFVNHGIYKLRGHPFLRSGTQHYSEDWEVRKAVQMISLVDSPVMRASQVTETNLALVQKFHSSIDKYFLKESRELKRSCKKEFVAQIKEVANVLNDGVVELNAIREELQSAVGNILNMFRKEKHSAPTVPSLPPRLPTVPSLPPRLNEQDLDNPITHSTEVQDSGGTQQNPGMLKGVMQKVNPFKSSSQVPETGVSESSGQHPGMFTGMFQKVNPFKSSTQAPKHEPQDAEPQEPRDEKETPKHEPQDVEPQEPRDEFKEKEDTQPLQRDVSSSEESLVDNNNLPKMPMSQEDTVDSDTSLKQTFRIKRILPSGLFRAKDLNTLADAQPLPQEVEVQTLEMVEMTALNDGSALDPLEDEDGLLAWWRTVDGWTEWNEATQNNDTEEIVEQAADRVFMAAQLFVRLFNHRGASLQQRILELVALADAADNFHKKTVTASIGGGVASVAGSITTITGLILAPFTAGTSLIVTAVGIGVATAGGVASASANITDTVHSKTDRKKVEKMIQDYQEQIDDIKECLEFLQEGMETLEEWNFEQYAESISRKHLNQNVKHVMKEGGRAGKALVINTESLINTVQVLSVAGGAAKAAQAISVTTGVMSGLFLALDVFFLAKDSAELKKGAKTEFAAKIREVCKDLQDGLLELNHIKEELQKTMDGIEVEVEEEDEEILKSDLKKLIELEE